MRLADVARPAVFGAFDGVVTVLGILFAMSGDPGLIAAAVGLAAAGTVSMAGGEWLSDSEHGLGASAVIGLTTGAGTMVPVVPYLWFRGAGAAGVSVVLCAIVGACIAWARSEGRGGPVRAAAETFGVLLAAAGAAALAAWLTGGVG